MVLELSVRTISGALVADLQLEHDNTVQILKSRISELSGIAVLQQRLIWGAAILADKDKLCDAGVYNGADLHLVKSRGFDAVTGNGELRDCGHTFTSRPKETGWASAFDCEIYGGKHVLSVEIGPTAGPKEDVTDYFIGALPADQVDLADENVPFLKEGCGGIALCISTHSHYSGEVSLCDGKIIHPLGQLHVAAGDVVSVEVDLDAQTTRFGHGEAWSRPEPVQFPVGVRLGVSMYSKPVADGRSRSVSKREPPLSLPQHCEW